MGEGFRQQASSDLGREGIELELEGAELLLIELVLDGHHGADQGGDGQKEAGAEAHGVLLLLRCV